MKVLKWEPSDQQDSIVLFLCKSETKLSLNGIALEFHYDGTIGKLYDEVLYVETEDNQYDEGEAVGDYYEFGDEYKLIRVVLNPPTWNF
jgi:hypothetical protein